MRTIFLDRDGVINENRDDHVTVWREFRFIPGWVEALRLLTQHQYRIFVVTNQGCVNRGQATHAAINDIHTKMLKAAEFVGAKIEGVRYCPHLAEEQCACRKPQPGMLLSLAREHRCDMSQAYMVGDAATDIAAGRAAGCRTALVRTGRGASQLSSTTLASCPPDIVVDDLLAAARWVCGHTSDSLLTYQQSAAAPHHHTRLGLGVGETRQ